MKLWILRITAAALLAAAPPLAAGPPEARPDAAAVAEQIDALIAARPDESRRPLTDEEFLTRLTLDLCGRRPTPEELTVFVLTPDDDKRARTIERLVGSEEFRRSQARYWREAILYRAQDVRARAGGPLLEEWLAEQLAKDRGWDAIVGGLVSATGRLDEDGQTAFLAAHAMDPNQMAAETSRLFLGIQIQCAQCHDHPYDSWKREEFHRLAAFFPRVRLKRVPDPAGKGKGGKRQFELTSQDVRLGRGKKEKAVKLLRRVEHFMPDLEHPEKPGTLMQPAFFVNQQSPGEHVSDAERRGALAKYISAADNPWFAKAFVNRAWAQLMGRGFIEPVDAMGSGDPPAFPEAFDALAAAFRANGHKPAWLYRVIASTRAYQSRAAETAPATGKPLTCATRLSADELFDALLFALGVGDVMERDGSKRPGKPYRAFGPRQQFAQLFGHDPSAPTEDVAGTIQQALFMMNSPLVNGGVRARGRTELAAILEGFEDDEDVIVELYLRTLARRPARGELATCLKYVRESAAREEAFEDIHWSLVNSTEFLTKR